ncbi:hypothetical protein BJV78DRAFT_485585 [Lactifluus subvellereus]|nr:hypothetical protein BJV78DRAFT_485585 [Lactifluus subvellereus]
MRPLSSLIILLAAVHRDILLPATLSSSGDDDIVRDIINVRNGLFLSEIIQFVLGRHVAFLKPHPSCYAPCLVALLWYRQCRRHRAVQRDAESALPSYYLDNSTRLRRPLPLPQPQEVWNQSRLRFPPQWVSRRRHLSSSSNCSNCNGHVVTAANVVQQMLPRSASQPLQTAAAVRAAEAVPTMGTGTGA